MRLYNIAVSYMDNVQKQKENIAYSTKKKERTAFPYIRFSPTFTLIISRMYMRYYPTCKNPPDRRNPVEKKLMLHCQCLIMFLLVPLYK
ncbi:hypothetical protein DWY58_13530 [Bacteroides stercoris]|uniref:Uncharacterized protein n=1 Tax=Bacteroides stercoris TaxID=46506 RepID=A0A3E4UJJ9_BACSE|nr:hypothetical protein DXC34_17425 [Bacteroides stercoris]RGR26829.1 hypothetical protein DWY58_13530 [Bacteroides stercoris]RGR33406.1 hypothetical protein DWY52_13770 [Bacteroides stercoris]